MQEIRKIDATLFSRVARKVVGTKITIPRDTELAVADIKSVYSQYTPKAAFVLARVLELK